VSNYSDVRLFRRLLGQARPYWMRIGSLLLLDLLSSPLSLLTPLPLKIAVDSVIGSHPLPRFIAPLVPEAFAHSQGALLALAVGLVLAIALLAQFQALGRHLLQAWVQEKLVLDFRTQLFRHAQRASLAYHDTRGTADSTYRIQRDAQSVQHVLTEGLIPLVSATVTFVATIYVVARIDWALALTALAIAPGPVTIARIFRRRLRRLWRDVMKLESAANSVVQEALGSLRIVKAFGQEAREERHFLGRSWDSMRARMRVAGTEGGYQFLVGLTTAIGTATILMIGIGHVRSGALTLGELLMVMGYLAQLYQPLKTMGQKAASLQLHLASAERAFSLLDEPPDVEDRPGARPLKRATGAVAFRNVTFAYGDDRPVLNDVSFDIGPGTRLGIAGASGAGKSTLISLLTRFYDPTAGEVRLDGIDLRDLKLEDLRRQCAVVPQDTVLFSTSIAENIGYAKPGAPRSEVIAAAQAANADAFIARLPQGYDTQVGERGIQLSGGQRQRIAIARAFLKDSPVLILDEPTSAVDIDTEAVIVEALERLQKGRTVIIISHRPTTLANCSAILTIERGRVVSDTTRALVQSTPKRASRAPARGGRLERLIEHPAVKAWRRLGYDRSVPAGVARVTRRPGRVRGREVYRLERAGIDGSSVIAKRCTPTDGLVERTTYEQILPGVPLPGPRYYGAVVDPSDDPNKEFWWLFIDEIQGEQYDASLPAHREAAGRWLAILHTEARPAADQAELPDAGPVRYREQMRGAGDLIRNHLDNPALTGDDVEFLDGLLSLFDQLDEHWDRLEHAATGLPRTFVHGDFNGKNLRVQATPEGHRIAAFDWAEAGRGVPTADLAQVVATQKHFCANPDLGSYFSVVRERWPDSDREDVERLATCGTVFRALAAIEWESHIYFPDWAHLFRPNLGIYEAELAHALERLGWTRPIRWATSIVVPENTT